jgi:glucosamine--fructose-6-phosphate aminotransferase (isomerizing)
VIVLRASHRWHYTDLQKERQLADPLAQQASMVSEFISEAWPQAKGQALEVLAPLASGIEEVLVFGSGDSYHAALGAEMAIAEWGGRRVRAEPAMTAARYLAPRMEGKQRKALWVGISVSGEVARTREALALGAAVGARTLGLTASPESSVARTAEGCITLPLPPLPEAPGLVSYVASMVMAYALAAVLSPPSGQQEIDACMSVMGEALEPWIEEQTEKGTAFAERAMGSQPLLFLGGGPARASALFAAAKVIEAAGVSASGQDVEEWAHLEYFADPADLPLWLLSANGRCASREEEVLAAAQAIGRRVEVSRWPGAPAFGLFAREALSPLALWAGPVAFAAQLADALGELPFRGFGGGRSREEGGGPSRIRSSRRIEDPKRLVRPGA